MNRIEVFRQMLKSEPENTMVLFGLANEYQKEGETQKAIETLELYLSKADDEGAAYGMLSRAYEESGDLIAAKEALEKGIETALSHGHPTMAGEFRERLEDFN